MPTVHKDFVTQGKSGSYNGGTPAVTVAADTTNQRAQVRVTGISAETWRWEAHLRITKVK